MRRSGLTGIKIVAQHSPPLSGLKTSDRLTQVKGTHRKGTRVEMHPERTDMTAKLEDLVTRTWRQQIGTAVRLAGVITEESRKVREYQLAAALEVQRSAAAALERLEKADANELWRIQGEWLSANLEKSLAYWRRLYEGSAQTQLGVLRCMCEPVDMAAPGAATEEARKAA